MKVIEESGVKLLCIGKYAEKRIKHALHGLGPAESLLGKTGDVLSFSLDSEEYGFSVSLMTDGVDEIGWGNIEDMNSEEGKDDVFAVVL